MDYKLGEEYTGTKSEYDTFFMSYLGLAAQIPNVFFNWINIFVNLGWVQIQKKNSLSVAVIGMKINLRFEFTEEMPHHASYGASSSKCWCSYWPLHWPWSIRRNGRPRSSGSQWDQSSFLMVRFMINRYVNRFFYTSFERFVYYSCRWNLSKLCVWYGRQIAIQIHWRRCVGIKH